MEAPVARKLKKTGLDVSDYFDDKESIFRKWVMRNSQHDLSLEAAMKAIETVFKEIQERSASIDPTLSSMTDAHAARVKKAITSIGKKMVRAEKRVHSDRLRQIEVVKDALFPNGDLQERTDNFLNFYQQDPDFIKKLLKLFDPFDFQFNVLSYHDQAGTP